MGTNDSISIHEQIRSQKSAILDKVGSLEFGRLYDATRHKHDKQYSRANGHLVLAAWNKAKRGLPQIFITPATNRALLRRRRIYRSKYSIDVALRRLSPAKIAGLMHKIKSSGPSIDDIVDRIGMNNSCQIFDFTLDSISDMHALKAPAPVTVCIARLVYGDKCTKSTIVGADFSFPIRFGLTEQEINDSERIFLFVETELQMPNARQQRMSRRGFKKDDIVEYTPKLAFACHELARRSSKVYHFFFSTLRFEYTENDLCKLDTLEDLNLNNKIKRHKLKKETARKVQTAVVAPLARHVRAQYFCVADAREIVLAETKMGFVSPLGKPRTFASSTQLLQYLRARTELCFTVNEETEDFLRVEVWLSTQRTDKLGYERPRILKFVNKNMSKILTFNTTYAPICLLDRTLTVMCEDDLALQTRKRLDVDWIESELLAASSQEKDFYSQLNAYIRKYCLELCRNELFLTLLLFRDRVITKMESPKLQTLYFRLLALKASFFMEYEVLTPDQEYAVVTGNTSKFLDVNLDAFEKGSVISEERAASLPRFHDKRTKPHDVITFYKRFRQITLRKRGKRTRYLLIPRKPGDYLPPRRFGIDRKTIIEGILQPDGTVLPTQQTSADPDTPSSSPQPLPAPKSQKRQNSVVTALRPPKRRQCSIAAVPLERISNVP